jgi:hypothetical protein
MMHNYNILSMWDYEHGTLLSKLKMTVGMNPLVKGDHHEQRRWELGQILGIHMRGRQKNDKEWIYTSP